MNCMLLQAGGTSTQQFIDAVSPERHTTGDFAANCGGGGGGEQEDDGVFRFTWVRDPVARLLSSFSQLEGGQPKERSSGTEQWN